MVPILSQLNLRQRKAKLYTSAAANKQQTNHSATDHIINSDPPIHSIKGIWANACPKQLP
ncbi:MAG: hypothetical protein ACI831_001228 [Candidatus Azotimanducaceae bacterium]|jgi:hypothetical protein